MRLPGDVLFTAGALLMAWDFIVKLRPLYPQAIDRLIFRRPLVLRPGSEPANNMEQMRENSHQAGLRSARRQADGPRVLVDRLWPRGLRKEKRSVDALAEGDRAEPGVTPMVGHEPARWAEFGQRYRAELTRNAEAVARRAAGLSS